MSKAAKRGSIVPQWENKIGMATIVGIVQLVAFIAGGGVLYGVITTKQDVQTTNILDLKQATTQFTKDAVKRDERFAAQNERIGKIETAVGFMQPAIQRIEAALSK